MRKVAKTMKPRKDDVSQLADEFLDLAIGRFVGVEYT